MEAAIVETLVYGILAPAVIAGVLLLVAWRPWQEEAPEGFWGGGFGFAAGYLAAHFGLNGTPDTMPYLVGGLAVVAGVEAFAASKRWLVWLVRVMVVPVATYLVAAFMFSADHWAGVEAVAWLAGFTVSAVAAIATLDTYAREHPGATVPISLLLLGTGAALVLALSGTARVGELLGGVTAMFGAAMVLSWWDGRLSLARGGVTVGVLLIASLVIFGYVGLFEPYQSVAGRSSLVLVVTPHLLWIDRLGVLGELEGSKGTALRAVLVGVGAAASVLLAWIGAGGA